MKYTIIILSLIANVFIWQGCYYDVEEELYPGGNCDTTNIQYSLHITPILNASCIACHSNILASGGVILDNYTDVKKYADSGQLVGCVQHQSGFKPMPQGQQKLSQCTLDKISAWVAAGAPNN